MTEILRIAAFSDGDVGGNPAGVVIGPHPPEPEMRRIAAEVGYSETAFAEPIAGGWRVRYFAPESEVAFCGHATIALGATARPHDRLDLQFTVNREWLDIDDSRLFTADVQRVRAQYSFSAKSLLRVIAQYVETDFGGDIRSGDFLGSVLYSYKLNWQTVLFAGYGDNRVLNESNDLEEAGRSFFFKVSYAFLR